MKYRQSLAEYAQKYGVSRASRRYNRARSYIYFWLKRYDGTLESLRCQSRRPHGHPNAHTASEKKLICDMWRRNRKLGLVEFWCRLRERGYSRSLVGLYRYMRKEVGYQPEKPKKKYIPKPYQEMHHPGERVQIDVKAVPRSCIVRAEEGERYYQYTAIDEKTRVRYMRGYQEKTTHSSADFLTRANAYFRRLGVKIETVQTDNGTEFTNRLISTKQESETLFEAKAKELGIKHILTHSKNKGYGGNQKSCYRKALELNADVVVMLHPDYQYTPLLIESMCYLIVNKVYPVVLGSRILGKGARKGPYHNLIKLQVAQL